MRLSRMFSASIRERKSKNRSLADINADGSTTNSSATKPEKLPREVFPNPEVRLCPFVWRNENAGKRPGSTSIVQIFDGLLHFSRKLLHIPHRQPGRRNRFPHPHLQRTALDVISVHGQQFVGSDQRHWNNIDL